jgi:predicted amidophosphoribosyltransferase
VNVPLDTAILLNIKTFGAAVIAVIVLLVAVSLLYRHPTRRCHRCGHNVRLDQRTCKHCGYDFAPMSYTC